jgi:hypothetical protein
MATLQQAADGELDIQDISSFLVQAFCEDEDAPKRLTDGAPKRLTDGAPKRLTDGT